MNLRTDDIFHVLAAYQAGIPINLDMMDKAVAKLKYYQRCEDKLDILLDITSDEPVEITDLMTEEQYKIWKDDK